MLGAASATRTITNDDVAVPLTPSSYKGATQDGNYVFFTVTANRTLTGFRINDLTNTCSGGGEITGGVDWSDATLSIADDGSFQARGKLDGLASLGRHRVDRLVGEVHRPLRYSDVRDWNGDREQRAEVQGTPHYSCSSGLKSWSAKLQ